jgi:hypothetical protein
VNGLSELKIPIDITHTSNQNPQGDGTKNDQKERNLGHLPLIILDGIKTEPEDDFFPILYGKKDDKNK